MKIESTGPSHPFLYIHTTTGLVKKMGEMADVTKLSQQLDPADAV